MSIEIKELIIKTTILDHPTGDAEESGFDKQAVKDEVLAECRQLILQLLRERGER
jgi:Family of unknown function (DUF5908)